MVYLLASFDFGGDSFVTAHALVHDSARAIELFERVEARLEPACDPSGQEILSLVKLPDEFEDGDIDLFFTGPFVRSNNGTPFAVTSRYSDLGPKQLPGLDDRDVVGPCLTATLLPGDSRVKLIARLEAEGGDRAPAAASALDKLRRAEMPAHGLTILAAAKGSLVVHLDKSVQPTYSWGDEFDLAAIGRTRVTSWH
jgi:hypothetical protein